MVFVDVLYRSGGRDFFMPNSIGICDALGADASVLWRVLAEHTYRRKID